MQTDINSDVESIDVNSIHYCKLYFCKQRVKLNILLITALFNVGKDYQREGLIIFCNSAPLFQV
jgi:hypothetical protein